MALKPTRFDDRRKVASASTASRAAKIRDMAREIAPIEPPTPALNQPTRAKVSVGLPDTEYNEDALRVLHATLEAAGIKNRIVSTDNTGLGKMAQNAPWPATGYFRQFNIHFESPEDARKAKTVLRSPEIRDLLTDNLGSGSANERGWNQDQFLAFVSGVSALVLGALGEVTKLMLRY